MTSQARNLLLVAGLLLLLSASCERSAVDDAPPTTSPRGDSASDEDSAAEGEPSDQKDTAAMNRDTDPPQPWPGRVTLSGAAGDAKGGAVLQVGDARIPVYLAGVTRWPGGPPSGTTRVEGTLVQRDYLPKATTTPEGVITQGVDPDSGPQWVLDDPRILDGPGGAPEAMPLALMRAAWPGRGACLTSIANKLDASGLSVHDFRVGAVSPRGDHLAFPLWHRDAFLPENQGVLGNPGGKCRDALCDADTGNVERFAFWQ